MAKNYVWPMADNPDLARELARKIDKTIRKHKGVSVPTGLDALLEVMFTMAEKAKGKDRKTAIKQITNNLQVLDYTLQKEERKRKRRS